MAGLRNSKHFPLYSRTMLIVGPERARTFAGDEWSKDDLTRHIHERARKPSDALARCGPRRGTNLRFAKGDARPDPDAMIAKFASMEEIHVVVAGGTAWRFSVAIPLTAQQAKRLAPSHARGGTNPLTSVQVHVILLGGSGTNGVR